MNLPNVGLLGRVAESLALLPYGFLRLLTGALRVRNMHSDQCSCRS